MSKIKGWDEDTIKASIPELPTEKRNRYLEYGLNEDQIETLIKTKDLYVLFDECASANPNNIKIIANYITSDVIGELAENENASIVNLTPNAICSLADMISTGSLSSRGAKDILKILLENGGDPEDIAKEGGFFQKSNEDELKVVVDKIIKENETAVEEYKSGKDQAIKFLVGCGMKETKGSGNPQILERLLRDSIK